MPNIEDMFVRVYKDLDDKEGEWMRVGDMQGICERVKVSTTLMGRYSGKIPGSEDEKNRMLLKVRKLAEAAVQHAGSSATANLARDVLDIINGEDEEPTELPPTLPADYQPGQHDLKKTLRL